ncbi:Hypothetical_protein [Hexamita inflata]|uniref:Hypothetical_protein n=1 Tax=Hexamita inflata TaxID=28002 RepID=A0ABP1HHF0_9EUKA
MGMKSLSFGRCVVRVHLIGVVVLGCVVHPAVRVELVRVGVGVSIRSAFKSGSHRENYFAYLLLLQSCPSYLKNSENEFPNSISDLKWKREWAIRYLLQT